MTYCIGWRYGQSVYLAADSVLSDVQSPSPLSSFGESQTTESGAVPAAESVLKLVSVAPGFAIAYAGHYSLAVAIVAFIREQHRNFPTLQSLIESVHLNVLPADCPTVQLLIATAKRHEQPSLLSWDTNERKLYEVSFAEIG